MEAFDENDKRFWRRWQNLRLKRLIEEDLIYLETVKDLSQIEILMTLLPARVGSLLSLNSLREDLNCSYESIKKWTQILENLYFHFRITPYTTNKLHEIKKEPKIFLWDWSLVEDAGAKFENFVASMLLKYCHLQEDAYGKKLSLHFFRAKDRREIDFIVCDTGVPIMAIECKSRSTKVAKSLVSLKTHFPNIPFFQVHNNKDTAAYVHKTGIKVQHIETFLDFLCL